jgi:hypothetical protein
MIRRWHRLARGLRSSTPSAEQSTNVPPQTLEARVQHLEAVIEGLQDAVYRQARQHDDDISELRKRIAPAELARALSDDARKRGL